MDVKSKFLCTKNLLRHLACYLKHYNRYNMYLFIVLLINLDQRLLILLIQGILKFFELFIKVFKFLNQIFYFWGI